MDESVGCNSQSLLSLTPRMAVLEAFLSGQLVSFGEVLPHEFSHPPTIGSTPFSQELLFVVRFFLFPGLWDLMAHMDLTLVPQPDQREPVSIGKLTGRINLIFPPVWKQLCPWQHFTTRGETPQKSGLSVSSCGISVSTPSHNLLH